jgi:uncharacterized protein YecT (DUF1311 family)
MKTHFHRASAFVAVLIAVTAFTPSFGQEPDWERPGTQEEAAVERANVGLDKVYKQLTRKLDAGGQKSLREAQQAWITWRDAEADLIARVGGAIGGSGFRVDYSNALRELIEQRTDLLRGYIKDAGSNQ